MAKCNQMTPLPFKGLIVYGTYCRPTISYFAKSVRSSFRVLWNFLVCALCSFVIFDFFYLNLVANVNFVPPTAYSCSLVKDRHKSDV